MAYETADVSNKEQIVVCIRWVDFHFTVHEDFVVRTTADEKVDFYVTRMKNYLHSIYNNNVLF